ncbi:hypothetical protein EQG66_13375 [Sphingobium fluviale]|uniref:Uncharacterized protein n=2 Tax=Sphingobium TaxID=165695 RepID=A0A4Q1KGN4_9SPHN|nr:hypothetical protein EQG66_13375 [Sphingobium fluviale]
MSVPRPVSGCWRNSRDRRRCCSSPITPIWRRSPDLSSAKTFTRNAPWPETAERPSDQAALDWLFESGTRCSDTLSALCVRNLQRHLSSSHSMRASEYRCRWQLPDGFDLRPHDVAEAAEMRQRVKDALKDGK